MYIHLITFFLLTALSIAAPAPQPPTPDPYDNFPWQLTNMVIVESPSNSTRLTFIKFDIQDPNPGLEVNTTCIRTVPGGTDLVSDIHFPCDNKSVGFSYRGSEIWLHHSWRNNVTLDITSCVGFAATSFDLYPLGNGVMKKQDHMEVQCTMQSGRK